MKCFVLLYGLVDQIIETNVDKNGLENCDTSELYSQICDYFPENTWNGLCCDSVYFHETHIEVHVSVF